MASDVKSSDAVDLALASFFSETGVTLLGCFDTTPEDEFPLCNDQSIKTMLIMGNAGSSFWPFFSQSPEYCDGVSNPLDSWSQRMAGILSNQLQGIAFFPFGTPRYPFIRWLLQTGNYQPSALGLLMHNEYGLWSACRFAIGLPYHWSSECVETLDEPINWCEQCVDKPCLQACPVNAFSQSGYDYKGCTSYLMENTNSPCMNYTCQARLACPIGVAYQYEKPHAAFHISQFVQSARAHRNTKQI